MTSWLPKLIIRSNPQTAGECFWLMFGQVACPPESLGLFSHLTKAMLQRVQGLYLAVHTVKSPSLLLRRLRHSVMNKLESSEYNTKGKQRTLPGCHASFYMHVRSPGCRRRHDREPKQRSWR